MTPKLTRPYVIQPVANGIALFPLEMVNKGSLEFAKVEMYTESWDLKLRIDELVNLGETDPEVTEIHQIPTDTP